MVLIAATATFVAALSKQKVHIISLERPSLWDCTEIDVVCNLPPNCRTSPDKVYNQCIDISPKGNKICVADSEKYIHVFESDGRCWNRTFYVEMTKRVKKIQFSPKREYLIITDKSGDVYLSDMARKEVSKPKRILGHCSAILDTMIAPDNSRIFTCDRDEKIRCSLFPNAYNIDSYLLGHKEAVVNIAIVNNGKNLLSVSAEGAIKLWNLTDDKCIQTWDFMSIFPDLKPNSDIIPEVRILKASQVKGRIYAVVKIQGIDIIPVFEIYIRGYDDDILFRFAGKLRNETEVIDFAWFENYIYMFTPELETVLKRYQITDCGIMPDTNFPDKLIVSSQELKHMAALNKPSFSYRRCASNQGADSDEPQNSPKIAPIRTMARISQIVSDDEMDVNKESAKSKQDRLRLGLGNTFSETSTSTNNDDKSETEEFSLFNR